MFRRVGDQPSLWESTLPEEVPRLPEELARVDGWLDDAQRAFDLLVRPPAPLG